MNNDSITRTLKKEQFLKRCETAWDMGIITEFRLDLVEKCLDFVMRFNNTIFSHGQTQGRYVWDFLLREKERIGDRSLANDTDLHSAIQFAAILAHPCQKCGEDKNAWHTRRSFCQHKGV